MSLSFSFFFFNDPATPEIYTLSLHDALPIYTSGTDLEFHRHRIRGSAGPEHDLCRLARLQHGRSEEHTSELQSHSDIVCRLLLEKKKYKSTIPLSKHKYRRRYILPIPDNAMQ